MGSVSSKLENTSDASQERSEQGQGQERGQELQDFQPGLFRNAQPITVPSVPLKSALKKNKPWFMVTDEVEKKEVRFNLADLEIIDEEDPMSSPPAPGYGVKFLETEILPGRDVDQAEVADDAPVLPDAANSPDAADTPVAAPTPNAASTPEAANTESKD